MSENSDLNLYRDVLSLIHKHKNVTVKAEKLVRLYPSEEELKINAYKLIIEFDESVESHVINDFIEHLVLNYSTKIISDLKIKTAYKIVLYVNKT